MLYRVQVPPGVQQGQFFTINAQGSFVKVRCPSNARAGQTIEVEVPTQTTQTQPPQKQQNQQQNQQYQQPTAGIQQQYGQQPPQSHQHQQTPLPHQPYGQQQPPHASQQTTTQSSAPTYGQTPQSTYQQHDQASGSYQQHQPSNTYQQSGGPHQQQQSGPQSYNQQQQTGPQNYQQQQQAPIHYQQQQYPNSYQQQQHVAPPPTPVAYDPNTIFRDADSAHKGYITAQDLQGILARSGFPTFKLRTCALMVRLFDGTAADKVRVVVGEGQINQEQFVSLWRYVEDWKRVFDLHDSNGSKTIDRQELEDSVRQFGYRFSSAFVARLLSIYDNQNLNVICFDDYIQMFCEIHTLTEAFKKYDTNMSGSAMFQYEQFLNAAYSIRM